ncbi:unnamed protein product [Effrenium voratum]|nr:unnamed protein product [Effrenium voratum]
MPSQRRQRRACAGLSALVTGAALKERYAAAFCDAWRPTRRTNTSGCSQEVRRIIQASQTRSASRTWLEAGRGRGGQGQAGQGLEASPLLLASLTGLSTGALVVLLNDFVHSFRDFLVELPFGFLAPAVSGLLVSLLLAGRGRASGGSDLASLKASGGVPCRDRTEAPLRALAAGLTLAGGNSLGPEGPSVEIGANVAAGLAGRPRDQSDERDESAESEVDRALRVNLLAAGCASGVAAGFNAPIAGLFFALESVQSVQSSLSPEEARARGPAMQLLAAVLAATVSQLGLGSSPAVDLDFLGWVPARSLWELPVFMLLGATCGMVASALGFCRTLATKAFASLEQAGCPRLAFPIIAGLIVVAVTVGGNVEEVLYKGFDNVNLILEEVDGSKRAPTTPSSDPILHLSLLLVAKVVLTAICQSSGQVGGLFAPALFMGACLGGLAGRVLRDNFWPWALNLPFLLGGNGMDGVDAQVTAFSVPATYAVVGMAACLGSICSVPLTSVVLLLELAGGKDYGVVLPTVAATGVAVYVEDFLSRGGPQLAVNWLQEATRGDGAFWIRTVENMLEQAALRSVPRKGSPLERAIPSRAVELQPGCVPKIVASSVTLEAARKQLKQLGPGARLAVVETEGSPTSGQMPQKLLGLVSLADVERAIKDDT